jgi:hypothetical protein
MDCHIAQLQQLGRSDGVALQASPIVRLVREAHFLSASVKLRS